ncbi:MAG: GTP-binding protein, partial [Cyanobacteriota bacterium]
VAVSRADRVPPADLEAVLAVLTSRVRAGTPLVPMARGVLPPELLLGGAGEDPLPEPAAGEAETPGEEAPHDHDHVHVAMESLVIRRWGPLARASVEASLRRLLADQPVLRLKGRLHEPGKRLALQLQAVGPRLECWYEGVSNPDPQSPSLELVALVPAAQLAPLRTAADALWPSSGA